MLTRRHALFLTLSANFGAKLAMGATTLATCPIELRGEWHTPEEAVSAVITRMRDVSLAGIIMRSDHQPDRLRVENKPSGFPAIWLHHIPAKTAWITVVVRESAWCQLAYQFGHELGHGLANSWEEDATEPPPSRWLEETLVEAFSLRGLGLLAANWSLKPPFPGDNAYGAAVYGYRQDVVDRYDTIASENGTTDLLKWYQTNKVQLSRVNGLSKLAQVAVPIVLGLIEPQPVLIEDYGGINRWKERSALPLPIYLQAWRNSCAEIGAPGRLPGVLAELLGIPI